MPVIMRPFYSSSDATIFICHQIRNHLAVIANALSIGPVIPFKRLSNIDDIALEIYYYRIVIAREKDLPLLLDRQKNIDFVLRKNRAIDATLLSSTSEILEHFRVFARYSGKFGQAAESIATAFVRIAFDMTKRLNEEKKKKDATEAASAKKPLAKPASP